MKKQVVFIMTDSTRKDMLGCYGNEKMITPNLDKLAENGIKYENAYTCQPVCGPARASIFTGTSPHTNGMVASCVSMREGVKNIGQILTSNNVHCGYIGKWHLDGGDYFGYGVCPDGWDKKYWYDMRTYLEELSYEDRVKSRKSETSYDPDMKEDFTYAHKCSNRAINFLDEYKNDDFLLVVSYDEPHGPCLCPSPYNTMYDCFKFDDDTAFNDDLSNKPFMQRLWAGDNLNKKADEINKPSKQLSLFLGCNSFVDYEIGRVLNKVNDIAPNAMIIFTSDHGEMLGFHKLNGKNASAYKEVANIPLIIKYKEKGKIISYPASHIDLAPTILDYMNIKIPVAFEGKSMMKQIEDTSVRINDEVFVEFTRYEIDHDGFGGLQMMRAIVNDRYKLVINLLDTDEFYDLEKDPHEMINLINDENYKDIRNSMHDKLLDNMNKTRDLYRGYQWASRPWRKDRIPSWNNDGYTRQRENEEGEIRQLDYETGLTMIDSVRKKKL